MSNKEGERRIATEASPVIPEAILLLISYAPQAPSCHITRLALGTHQGITVSGADMASNQNNIRFVTIDDDLTEVRYLR